jgi:hypothetical protein
MFALLLAAPLLLVAVASLLGLSADSRDLRPRRPVQARGEQPQPGWTEPRADTALPPYAHVRLRQLRRRR